MSLWKKLFRKKAEVILTDLQYAQKIIDEAQGRIDELKNTKPIDFMIEDLRKMINDIVLACSQAEMAIRHGNFREYEKAQNEVKDQNGKLELLLLDIKKEAGGKMNVVLE
jgi:hypothetical protein